MKTATSMRNIEERQHQRCVEIYQSIISSTMPRFNQQTPTLLLWIFIHLWGGGSGFWINLKVGVRGVSHDYSCSAIHAISDIIYRGWCACGHCDSYRSWLYSFSWLLHRRRLRSTSHHTGRTLNAQLHRRHYHSFQHHQWHLIRRRWSTATRFRLSCRWFSGVARRTAAAGLISFDCSTDRTWRTWSWALRIQ